VNPFISKTLDDTIRFGESMGGSLKGGEVLILSGQLGSGKTVLAKGIAAGLGVRETVTSPSFAILNVYRGRVDLYHFDFYRLDDQAEMEEMLEDYAYRPDGVAVIEWGERILARLGECVIIRFQVFDTHRLITLERRVG
jgi:tRNA threonylcarbamoyladenosine biosynthesis protein TsaE